MGENLNQSYNWNKKIWGKTLTNPITEIKKYEEKS